LINALRTDRNECVRLEAAYALGRGCCCNKLTIEKLRLTVEGSDKDGNPPETSMRVRAAAAAALNHCLTCVTEKLQREEGLQEEKPKPPAGGEGSKNNDSASYNRQIESMSMAQILQRARFTLEHADLSVHTQMVNPNRGPSHSGLVDVLQKAFTYSGPPSDGPQVIREAPMTASTTIRPVPQPASSPPPLVQPVKNVKPMNYTPAVPAPQPTVPAPQQPVVKPVTPATSSAGPATPYQGSAASSRPVKLSFEASAFASSEPMKPEPQPSPIVFSHPVTPVQQPRPAVSSQPVTPVQQPSPVVYNQPVMTVGQPNSVVSSQSDKKLPEKKLPEPMPVRQVAAELPGSPFAKVTPISYQPAAVTPPAHGPSAADMQQMLSALNNSLYPDQRERAAGQLASADWRTSPQVVHALITGARKDPAAMVRVGCVRSLAKMNANTPTVIDTLQALRGDSDPRVRTEAGVALAALARPSGARAVPTAGSSFGTAR